MTETLVAQIVEMKSEQTSQDRGSKKNGNVRAEIDTSAPFESVKEAVIRFGGNGYWKSSQNVISESKYRDGEFDVSKLEEQAGLLQKELVVKERETLDVLKELESTKQVVEDFKCKLQKEATDAGVNTVSDQDVNDVIVEIKHADKETQGSIWEGVKNSLDSLSTRSENSLKQAKNLARTTNDLADIRASTDLLTKKLENERMLLEKTCERLAVNFARISTSENELDQLTRLRLQHAKDAEIKCGFDNPPEAKQFKRMGEAANSQMSKMMSEIDQTKIMIRTAEIRYVAARKMKDAARAAEAIALEEIKSLSHRQGSCENWMQGQDEVTLSLEEYNALTSKAQEAELLSSGRVVDAMLQGDEANVSKMEILRRVEEAAEEVKSCKKALEEALGRVEAANKGKLAVEEAMRKWRSGGQKRRGIHNSAKFKNSALPIHGRESDLLDANGLVNVVSTLELKPTVSIGQILSRKLLLTEEFERGIRGERNSFKGKVSLGQMLGKKDEHKCAGKADGGSHQKQFPSKRKKLGFARFSHLLVKEAKRKKLTPNLK